jgi:hypothetical protein
VNHLPQLAVIGLDNVVEILYLPMLRVLRKRCPDCVKVLNVGYEPEDADLNIAYPRDRTSSAKLLALTRHLRSAFGSPLLAHRSASGAREFQRIEGGHNACLMDGSYDGFRR